MKVFQQGETPVITCDITNAAGTAVSPDTSMKILIDDPTGAEKQALTDMTEDATGDYSYSSYTIPATIALGGELGVWSYECVAVNGGKTTIKGGKFEVVRRIT